MTLKQIRMELLGQHATLRHEIYELRALVERWAHSHANREDVRAALRRFGELLEEHNQREETALETIIPTIDAFGTDRAEIMSERHVEEHHELYGAFIVVSEAPTAEKAAPLLQFLCNRLLEHMAREEEAFLGRDLLVDEAGTA